MKKFHVIVCFTSLLGLFSNAGCKKETPTIISFPPDPPLPQLPLGAAPKANAGQDILVILPIDFSMLYGSASYIDLPIKSYAWKKISGPSTYILETPDGLGTKVSNLEKGIYEFELTVTDKAGLTGKDTATVIVGEMSANPKDIIFKDLVWSCPWYCGVDILNIFSHLPSGSVFKVYIQRDNSASWLEVVSESQWSANDSYWFDLYNGDLWIYYIGSDLADKPDIKIVY